ncbi:MAG: ATP-dependent DNA helicase [Actinomycetota bacterium]|nr:ATP-dependent DNA helicase [Actinomycetota bacterium]
MSEPAADVLAQVVSRLPRGGEPREGQTKMAVAVEAALASGRHLIVRAGTGTGKSLGYLVPAICSGKRVVVATATKALQDQLAGKDLPLLATAMGRTLSFAVLKGRSNYLCRQRIAESGALGAQGQLVVPAGEPSWRARQVRVLLEWAEATTSGDQSELTEPIDAAVWSSFAMSAEECPGASRCPSGESCFAERARAEAAAADVVVTNLHLLGADIAALGAVLDDYDALVVDEAHALEDIVTDCLGAVLSPGRIRAAAALANSAAAAGGRRRRGATEPAADDLLKSADALEAALAARGEARLSRTESELEELLGLLGQRIAALEDRLRQANEAAKAAGGGDVAVQGALSRALLVAGRLREDVGELLGRGDNDVCWIAGGGRPALVRAPIDVAPYLAERVFAKRTVVLTSATIPPGLAARLGAPPGETDEIDVGSPFAYERLGLLYCAAHLPDRRRSDSERAVHEEIAALIEAAGGRSLALFTSRVVMERAAAAMRARLSVPILSQGEGPKGSLLARFASEDETCLFATMGFWQGVDVAGSSLSCVIIDRIPFPRPDDPLIAARRERAGTAAFGAVDLPRAASLLAQGAGRLIRHGEDRGVVAVLDSRLATATYRWDLVRALPPLRRTKVRAEAEDFLRALRAPAVGDAPS